MDMGCFLSPRVLSSFLWHFKGLIVEIFMSVLLLLPRSSSWYSLHLGLACQWQLVSILFIIWSIDFSISSVSVFFPQISTSLLKWLLNFVDFLPCFPSWSCVDILIIHLIVCILFQLQIFFSSKFLSSHLVFVVVWLRRLEWPRWGVMG